jgi:1-deoxy-D-xylulose-5-phosphate synthase
VGTGVEIAVRAAELLNAGGVSPTVVDARFIKPLDAELLDDLAQTHERIVTIEENTVVGGFGGAVAEHVAETGVSVVRFGLPDAFVRHGDRLLLLAEVGLTPEAVAASVLERRPGFAHVS